jgi:nitrogen fixation/metabolism regulation signal transduction histidine kinase
MNKKSETNDKQKNRLKYRIISFIKNINLVSALLIAMVLSAILVFIGLRLYFASNLYRIDLSKPKYAAARSEVSKNEIPQDEFNSGGPLDKQTIQRAIDLLKKRRQEIRDLGDFSENNLSDKALNIE